MSFSRFLLVLLKVVAGLVGLVLVLYVAVNAVGMIQGATHRGRLAEDITARLADQVPSARERADGVAAGASHQPDHAWLEQDCAFATDEGGWIVISYREVCVLRSVTAWQVAGEAEARAVLADVQGLRPLQATPAGGCVDVAHGATGTPSYVAPWDEADRPWCLGSVGPAGYGEQRPVSGEPVDLDPSRGWLVLEHEQQLVDEDLGCVHWSVIFCDNPFGDELAWGDPPD